MKVLLILEFEDIEPNSPEADSIVCEISKSCETMQVAFDANSCYIEEVLEP